MKEKLFFVRGLGELTLALWVEGKELSVWLTHTVTGDLLESWAHGKQLFDQEVLRADPEYFTFQKKQAVGIVAGEGEIYENTIRLKI